MLVLEYYNGKIHAFYYMLRVMSERLTASPHKCKVLVANVELTSHPATILRDFERSSR